MFPAATGEGAPAARTRACASRRPAARRVRATRCGQSRGRRARDVAAGRPVRARTTLRTATRAPPRLERAAIRLAGDRLRRLPAARGQQQRIAGEVGGRTRSGVARKRSRTYMRWRGAGRARVPSPWWQVSRSPAAVRVGLHLASAPAERQAVRPRAPGDGHRSRRSRPRSGPARRSGAPCRSARGPRRSPPCRAARRAGRRAARRGRRSPGVAVPDHALDASRVRRPVAAGRAARAAQRDRARQRLAVHPSFQRM